MPEPDALTKHTFVIKWPALMFIHILYLCNSWEMNVLLHNTEKLLHSTFVFLGKRERMGETMCLFSPETCNTNSDTPVLLGNFWVKQIMDPSSPGTCKHRQQYACCPHNWGQNRSYA